MNDSGKDDSHGTHDAKSDTAGIYASLAGLPDDALVDENAIARAFGVVNRTVRRMVTRGELPPPVRFAGRAVWIAGRVRAWLNESAGRAEAEARQHLERIRRMGA